MLAYSRSPAASRAFSFEPKSPSENPSGTEVEDPPSGMSVWREIAPSNPAA